MADLVVRTYDPKNVKVIIGVVPVSGLVSIKVAQPDVSFEKVRTSDGTVSRTAKNVRDYEVTLVVNSTSLINNVLSELHGADLQNNQGTFLLIIQDLNQGIPLLIAETAWITKYAETEKGESAADMEWVIDTGQAEYTPGGALITIV